MSLKMVEYVKSLLQQILLHFESFTVKYIDPCFLLYARVLSWVCLDGNTIKQQMKMGDYWGNLINSYSIHPENLFSQIVTVTKTPSIFDTVVYYLHGQKTILKWLIIRDARISFKGCLYLASSDEFVLSLLASETD